MFSLLRYFNLFAALICLIPALTSCTGYQLGSSKPNHLKNIVSLHVPLMENDTFLIRADALGTNALVDAITRDGTYRISTVDKAHGTLFTQITSIKDSLARSTRLDSLRSEELDMRVIIKWQILGTNNVIVHSGTVAGSSRLFVANNLQTARNNALPDALRNASEKLVAQLAHGF